MSLLYQQNRHHLAQLWAYLGLAFLLLAGVACLLQPVLTAELLSYGFCGASCGGSVQLLVWPRHWLEDHNEWWELAAALYSALVILALASHIVVGALLFDLIFSPQLALPLGVGGQLVLWQLIVGHKFERSHS